MAVEGYVVVPLCTVAELRRLIEAAGWEISEASRPLPELEALRVRLRTAIDAVSDSDADRVCLTGKAEW